MRMIAIEAQKGGAGMTTLVVHLAVLTSIEQASALGRVDQILADSCGVTLAALNARSRTDWRLHGSNSTMPLIGSQAMSARTSRRNASRFYPLTLALPSSL